VPNIRARLARVARPEPLYINEILHEALVISARGARDAPKIDPLRPETAARAISM
jgi:hypothetical protein